MYGIRNHGDKRLPWLPLLACCFMAAWPLPTSADDKKTADTRPHLAILIAESEYHTETTLPEFAHKFLQDDFQVTIVQGDPNATNQIEGLVPAVEQADLLLISMRRRVLPKAQLEAIKHYVAAGKPVVGIRTACHAFSLRDQGPPEGCADWQTFDPDVLGGHYTGHHKVGPTVTISAAEAGSSHPILAGVTTAGFESEGSLYEVSPLDPLATPLLVGSIPDAPSEPLAWTFVRPDGGRSFYTSLGHETDFAKPSFNILLRNALRWAAARSD